MASAERMDTPSVAAGPAAAWWKDAVLYQVYVRSFCDADGDGIGDLPGVRAGLPYLAELGVDGIWLSPCFPSPQHDHGYDVTDYTGIEPAYGSLADFDAVVADAHALGLKVILDVVPNHCSVEHPLFRQALREGPGSAARELFHFADGRGPDGAVPPSNWRSIFGGSVWERVVEPDGRPGQWYLHLFTPAQPDWNWNAPLVRAMFAEVLAFWLDRGVDGFRVDAAGALFKGDIARDVSDPAADERTQEPANPQAWGRPPLHELYRSWRRLCDERAADDGVARILVGEISGFVARDRLHDFLRADELHEAFLFELLDAPWDARRFQAIIRRELRQGDAAVGFVAWTLGNHDRTRMATRYAIASDPDVGPARARAASLLLLALPGPAFLYQGDELSLPEVEVPDAAITDPVFKSTNGLHRGRDGCRVPLPWNGAAAPFGFSLRPGGGRPWLPQPDSFATHTIERQRGDRASSWRMHRDALELRRRLPAQAIAPLEWLDLDPDVVALRRGDGFVCATNFASEPLRAPTRRPPTIASATMQKGWLAPCSTAWWLD